MQISFTLHPAFLSCALVMSNNCNKSVVPINRNQEIHHDVHRIHQHLFLEICDV